MYCYYKVINRAEKVKEKKKDVLNILNFGAVKRREQKMEAKF